MRLNASVLAVIVVVSTYAISAQAPSQTSPRDDAYVSTHRPSTTLTSENVPIKDDALGRIDWMREVMGGDLTPEFMEAMMVAGDTQRAQYGPAGRGAMQVPAGGAWTNIGPYRSDWIQNGLQVAESDTGRVRTFWCIRRILTSCTSSHRAADSGRRRTSAIGSPHGVRRRIPS